MPRMRFAFREQPYDLVALVAVIRRVRPQRLALSIVVSTPRWDGLSPTDKLRALAAAGALFFGAGTLAYVAGQPLPTEHFTEFYVLDATGGSADCPLRLNASEIAVVTLGI